MALTPPEIQLRYGTADLSSATATAATFTGALRACPQNAMQFFWIEAMVWNTSTSKYSYLCFIAMTGKVGAGATAFSSAGTTAYLGNAAVWTPTNNAWPVFRLFGDDDAGCSIEATLTTDTINIQAKQPDTTRRLWFFLVRQYTTIVS